MSEENSKPSITRRNFLGIAWLAALVLAGIQAGLSILKFIKPLPKGGYGSLVLAGRIQDFAVNTVNRNLTGRFYISRTEDGMIALWQKCPHLGCAVPWDEEQEVFHCPCHGSTFNKVGDVLGGPAPRAMDFFPIEINQEEVWVDTSSPVARGQHNPSHVTNV